MASVEECDEAIKLLATRFGADGGARSGGLDRSVSANITDLGLRYRGHLHDGILDDIQRVGDDDAAGQIRLTMGSDDLRALAADEVSIGDAWRSGRLRLQASLPDMLRLRSML